MCFSITFVLIAIIATILFIFFERFCCLSPDGESGLKCNHISSRCFRFIWSLPGWGEWVEIIVNHRKVYKRAGLTPDRESGLK